MSKGGLNKSSRVFFLFGLYPLGRGSAAASCSRCRVSASKFLDDVYIDLKGFFVVEYFNFNWQFPHLFYLVYFPDFHSKNHSIKFYANNE